MPRNHLKSTVEVVVAGGGFGAENSVEIFSMRRMEWRRGPR